MSASIRSNYIFDPDLGAPLRSLRSLSIAVTLACVPHSAPDGASRAACVSDALRRWQVPPAGYRSLRVWLDSEMQEHDGWGPYGLRRLRVAMDEWNSLRLPVRFIQATSARQSEIVVDVIRSLPVADDSTARDQAAVTNLTYEPSGAILKAHVLIAVATPIGRRYPLPDQQANLLHELGHSIGLPHITETGAVMATRRTSYQLTGADIALARRHYTACRGT